MKNKFNPKFTFVKIPFLVFFFGSLFLIIETIFVWNFSIEGDFVAEEYKEQSYDLQLCKEASKNYEANYLKYLNASVDCQAKLADTSKIGIEKYNKPECELDYVKENYNSVNVSTFNSIIYYSDETCQLDLTSYTRRSLVEYDSNATYNNIQEYRGQILVAYVTSNLESDNLQLKIDWYDVLKNKFTNVVTIDDIGDNLIVHNMSVMATKSGDFTLTFEVGLPALGCNYDDGNCNLVDEYIERVCLKGKLGIWVFDSETKTLEQVVKFTDYCK